jgi:hypothetical protein
MHGRRGRVWFTQRQRKAPPKRPKNNGINPPDRALEMPRAVRSAPAAATDATPARRRRAHAVKRPREL